MSSTKISKHKVILHFYRKTQSFWQNDETCYFLVSRRTIRSHTCLSLSCYKMVRIACKLSMLKWKLHDVWQSLFLSS